jgi:hypothetical protein
VVGSLSAIGEIVYVAEFTHQRTIGYMMHSGRRVFTYPKGTYTPIISDGQNLYVTGYSSITALAPIHPVKPGISNAFVAPAPPGANAKVKTKASRGKARPGAAAAGAARRAQRRGKARREAGR